MLPDEMTEAGTAAMELDVEADVEAEEVDEDGSRGGPSKPTSRIGATNGLELMTPDPDPPAHSKTTAISRGRTREREVRPLAVASTSGRTSRGQKPRGALSAAAQGYLAREGSLETSNSSRPPSLSSRTRNKGKGRRNDAERSVTPDEFNKLRRNPQLVTPPLTADNLTNTSGSTPSASNSVRSSSRVWTNATRGNAGGGGMTTEGSRLSTPARDHPLQYLQHQLPQPQSSAQVLQGGGVGKGKGRATGSTSVVSDLREEREASAERGESSSRSLRPRTTHVSYTYSLLDPSHPNHPLNHQACENASTAGACASGTCNHPHHHHLAHNGGNHHHHHHGKVDIEAPRGLDGKPLPTCLTCGSVLPVISVDEQVVWGIWASQKTGKRGRPKKEKSVEMECPRYVVIVISPLFLLPYVSKADMWIRCLLRCMRHLAIYNVKWPERCMSDGSKAFDVSPPRPWRGPLLDKEKEKEREGEKARSVDRSRASSINPPPDRASTSVSVSTRKPTSSLGKRVREDEENVVVGGNGVGASADVGGDEEQQPARTKKKQPTGRPRGRPPKTRVGMSASTLR